MTPLAHRIVKSLTLPVKDRCKTDFGDLMHKMDDVHCFDVTEVAQLIHDLGENIANGGVDVGAYCFLPAPKTWIEYGTPGGYVGKLLTETDAEHFSLQTAMTRVRLSDNSEKELRGSKYFVSEIIQRFKSRQSHEKPEAGGRGELIEIRNCAFEYAALALINTPRLIGRRQHMPHRGLERRLLKQQKLLGHFPLHAWTEIKLEVTPPEDAGGSPSTEAHLTGRKALHFCRAHLRVRDGRVAIVRGHWRGDAALGIKRSRYRLTGAAA